MKIGIIVGRFQCHKLTDGHKELIKYVTSKSDKVLIFIGVSPLKPDIKNPLPFEMRKQMVIEYMEPNDTRFDNEPNVEIDILPIIDVFDVPKWSKILDKEIQERTTPHDEVMLYGGRDSFKYTGVYSKYQIESSGNCSATELRNKVLATDISNVGEDFRKGIIWAIGNIDA